MTSPQDTPSPQDRSACSNAPRDASRRQFLAATTLGATTLGATTLGVAGASLAGSAEVATNAPASWSGFGDDEIKVGVIGCGGRGSGAAANLMHTPGKLRVVALADAFEHRMTASVEQLEKEAAKEAESRGVSPTDLLDVPEERRFIGLDAYKKVLESNCDLVVLATPPGFRPEQFEAAVDAGKHVFMEKPVATDAPGIRRVLAAGKRAAEKGLAVQVGLQRRHEEKYRQVISRLHEGAIGDIMLTRVYFNTAGVWTRPRESHQSELQYQVNNWYYFNWLCGDQITEQHIHNLDISNWVKQSVPVDAQGQGGRQVRTGKEHGQIFDHAMVEYTYEDGSKMLSQSRHQPDCWGSIGEHAHGTKGTADISGGKIFNADGKVIYRYKGKLGKGSAAGHQMEQNNLIAALRAGQLPNECEYGALSTMTAILGRMAVYSGKKIKWEDALASKQVLVPDGLTWDSEPPVSPDADGRYPVPVPGKTEVL